MAKRVSGTPVGHAELAGRGLQLALEGLVADRRLSLDHALALVPRLMHDNAERLFPLRQPAPCG